MRGEEKQEDSLRKAVRERGKASFDTLVIVSTQVGFGKKDFLNTKGSKNYS